MSSCRCVVRPCTANGACGRSVNWNHLAGNQGDGNMGFPEGLRDPALSELYFTDFSDPAELTSGVWRLFNGPGNNNFGIRDPNAIEVIESPDAGCSGSMLRMTATNVDQGDGTTLIHSGGMALRPVTAADPSHAFTYGTVSVRARQSDDSAQATSGLALLWPDPNPPAPSWEIDIFETFFPAFRATRDPMQVFIHDVTGSTVAGGPTGAGGTNYYQGDGSDWHIYQMSWQPDAIQVRYDCGPWQLVTDNPAHISDVPMAVALQLDAWQSGIPGNIQAANNQPFLNEDVTMDVDWLLVEAA